MTLITISMIASKVLKTLKKEDSRLACRKITFTNLSEQTLAKTLKQDLELVIRKAAGIEPPDRNKTRQANEPFFIRKKKKIKIHFGFHLHRTKTFFVTFTFKP